MSSKLDVQLPRSSRPRPPRLGRQVRLAARLSTLYAERARAVEPPSLPQGAWRRANDRQALLRRYASPGARLGPALRGLERLAVSLQGEVDSYLDRLRFFARRPAPPAFRELFAELLALEEEFEEVEIDLSAATLAVVTDPIELEGVELGRFRIVLKVAALDDAEFAVAALAPREPASSDFARVVHPHVKDETLCEGQAHEPIRAALAQGRLCDFFVVVDRTLKTYNPAGAYARLAEWEGVDCQDCGCRTSEDRTLTCGECGDLSCFDCIRSCAACDGDLCGYCSKECSVCGRRFCGGCLAETSDGEDFCSDCFEKRENEREALFEAIDDEGEPVDAAAPVSAVHALRLGEADLST